MRSLPLARHPRRGCALTGTCFVVVLLALVALSRALGCTRIEQTFYGKVTSDLRAIESALDEYAWNHAGSYPDSLEPLLTLNGNRFTYLGRLTTLPLDPWGHEYRYEPPCPDQPRPRVYSLGKDGALGGLGDDCDVDNFMVSVPMPK